MDWINYTTAAGPTTTEWAAWSEYESEYNRATKAGSVVGPVVGSFIVIIFIISVFCFTSHVRRRRQEILARAARRNINQRQGERAFVVGHAHSPDWIGGEEHGSYTNTIMQDLPPPYTPPYETELKDGDLPPSYADAVVMYGYDTERDDVTRTFDESDVNYDVDYDTDNMTDYSVDDDVNTDATYDVDVPYDATNETRSCTYEAGSGHNYNDVTTD
ncbi:uncharacterized protein LOC117339274 [Pecten maximus]|uniref:uncharacterized protein LOC117339274 n=1 Tax=Pecten maximus TaxID=6579 RepID=UPI0014584AB5|nr:uncharacterized protein LOC117339274 [Pecten maximus]XP_033756670.1 uncharacterized protein LOC117339274 [Pecten maximus]XP_033756671.1 uncharacterized protein LOC117339274 [Pecten maximus]XP_033756672.1 uncharacterized protein LOC117339274 [Pecten maximus]